MAVRPEAIPSLRPSTYSFMLKTLCSGDVGLKSVRKDFGVCGSGTTRVSLVYHSLRLECQGFCSVCSYRGQAKKVSGVLPPKDVQSKLINGMIHS